MRKTMRAGITSFGFLALLGSGAAVGGAWEDAKNIADDIIHQGISHTFYCGCKYESDSDDDGSGDVVSTQGCGYSGPSTFASRAGRIEWEHVVPASLMPARNFHCWSGPDGSRSRCETGDPRAQAMLFDLHNLVPAVGQVNALRGNDRYADLPGDTSDFGGCTIEDAAGGFEPPDCHKGDVARIWLYMREMYGVVIPPDELAMFVQWAGMDPVSPWESERERRAGRYERVRNPFVYGVTPDPAGFCAWD